MTASFKPVLTCSLCGADSLSSDLGWAQLEVKPASYIILYPKDKEYTYHLCPLCRKRILEKFNLTKFIMTTEWKVLND